MHEKVKQNLKGENRYSIKNGMKQDKTEWGRTEKIEQKRMDLSRMEKISVLPFFISIKKTT